MKGPDHCQSSGCPIACTLDIIGDRWTLLVIRDLMFFEHHEYKDLLAIPEGISTNILADRLKRLQDQGIIESIPHPDSRTRKLYYLTQSGKDLIHVMVPIILWGAKHLDDVVRIPPHKRQGIDDPEKLKQATLQNLEAWETMHLPSSSTSKKRGSAKKC